LIIKTFFISIIIIFSSKAFSTNVRVVDFQKIIDNYRSISLLYNQINEDQLPHKELFKIEELNLQNELERIEKLNLILDSSEIEKEIQNYNKQLNDFNSKIEKFNLHYEVQINNLKNIIANLILEELKKYSEDNNIDLVLDSNNYILSSNSINITDFIIDMINKKKIDFNFEKY